MSMPGMDGADVYRALKTINPKLKVILSSGSVRTEKSATS